MPSCQFALWNTYFTQSLIQPNVHFDTADELTFLGRIDNPLLGKTDFTIHYNWIEKEKRLPSIIIVRLTLKESSKSLKKKFSMTIEPLCYSGVKVSSHKNCLGKEELSWSNIRVNTVRQVLMTRWKIRSSTFA